MTTEENIRLLEEENRYLWGLLEKEKEKVEELENVCAALEEENSFLSTDRSGYYD
jgi:hypothetical protein